VLLAGNTALDEALTAQQRSYRVRLLADWAGDGAYAHAHSDLSGAVERLNFDRSAGNDLPEEVELVQGFSFGSLRATLVGDVAGTPVTTLFSTYVSSSPFYGDDLVGTRVKFTVTVDTASGPVVVPQSRGVLRSVSVKSEARRVDIEILDPAGAMYAPITLPLDASMYSDKYTSVMTTYVHSQWVIDHVLRRNGIYITPPPPEGAILSVTGHGGLGAEIGWNGVPNTYNAATESDYVPSRWPGMLATPGAWAKSGGNHNIRYSATKGVDLNVDGQGIAVEGWFDIGANSSMGLPTTSGGRVMFDVYPWEGTLRWLFGLALFPADNIIQARMVAGSTQGTIGYLNHTLSGDSTWRHVGIHIRGNGAKSMTLTLSVDGVAQSTTFTSTEALPKAGRRTDFAVQLLRSSSNLSAWLTPTAPAEWPGLQNANHVPHADVPNSGVRMSYLPAVRNGNSLDVLKSVVTAEFGRFGFTEEGRFYFRPADRSEGDTSSVDREVTSEFPLSDLSTGRMLDSVRNVVTAMTRQRHHDPYQGTTVVDADDVAQFRSPTGAVSAFPVDLPEMVASSGGFSYYQIPFVTALDWDSETYTGWHAVRVNDTTMTQSTGVTVAYQQTAPYTAQIVVDNQSGYDVQFQLPDANGGAPALRHYGYPIEPTWEHTFEAFDRPSIDKYGRRSFGIAPSEWRSLPGPYDDIAGELMVALRKPVTTLADVRMVGDPRDQIGDLHKINDPDGAGGPIYGLVQAINRTFSRTEGLHQTVTYRVQRSEVQNSYKLWPTGGGEGASAVTFTGVTATEFYVTSTCWVTEIRYYRLTTAVTGTEGRIYRVDSSTSGTPVDGTYVAMPASGTGWQPRVLPEPVILEAGQRYRVAVLFSGTIALTASYWYPSSGLGGSNGISNGPLVAPNSAEVTGGKGQGSYKSSSVMTYPSSSNSGDRQDCYWIDVTVADTPFG
jgi:hypothetical protein